MSAIQVPPPAPGPLPPNLSENGVASLVRLAVAFYGVVTVFALGYDVFARMRGGANYEGPLLGLGLPSVGLLGAGLAIGLVLVAVTHVGMRVWHGVADAAQVLSQLIGPITRKQALMLAALSGTAEELLFRGALWPHLGLLGTTFLFALVHIVPRKALWGYPLFAALAGLLLGILRDASGSVLPCIVMHVTVNAINLTWLGANHARFAAKPKVGDSASHG